jgi:rod shape-determining protein MreB
MTEDIAIDLGTANTLIIHNDKVVIDSPSIVAETGSLVKSLQLVKKPT